MLNLSQYNKNLRMCRPKTPNAQKYTLTYLYKHLVDINGILSAGFYKDGMDGVSIVLGILFLHFSANTRDMSICIRDQ